MIVGLLGIIIKAPIFDVIGIFTDTVDLISTGILVTTMIQYVILGVMKHVSYFINPSPSFQLGGHTLGSKTLCVQCLLQTACVS